MIQNQKISPDLNALIDNFQNQMNQLAPLCPYTHETLKEPVILNPCLHIVNKVALLGFKQLLEAEGHPFVCPVANCKVISYKEDSGMQNMLNELQNFQKKINQRLLVSKEQGDQGIQVAEPLKIQNRFVPFSGTLIKAAQAHNYWGTPDILRFTPTDKACFIKTIDLIRFGIEKEVYLAIYYHDLDSVKPYLNKLNLKAIQYSPDNNSIFVLESEDIRQLVSPHFIKGYFKNFQKEAIEWVSNNNEWDHQPLKGVNPNARKVVIIDPPHNRINQVVLGDAENAKAVETLWQMAPTFGIKLLEKQKENLNFLMKKIMPKGLVAVLGQVIAADKPKLFSTFLEIGQKLSQLPWMTVQRQLLYTKKIKGQTFAFAINGHEILIVQNKIGEGSFKKVNEALNLETLKSDRVRLMVKNKGKGGIDAVKEAQEEYDLIQILHKNNEYISLPFYCKFLDKDFNPKKLVMFQLKYDYVGVALIGSAAPTLHKVAAFKDVAVGLAKMHQTGYVHMDLKPGNFLLEGSLVSKKPVKARLTDFGLTVKTGSLLKGATPMYLPPQALQMRNGNVVGIKGGSLVGPEFDSYALGVTIIESLFGTAYITKKVIASFTGWDMINFFQQLKQEIDSSSLNAQDKKAQKELLDVAQHLIKASEIERWSCHQAAARLAEIQKANYP